ncbi:TetR/AcrR family transcriptional regulator [Kibdelosporangium persicum]|uniref:DNA-binding transcriptional regulator, AcrR family n=1 Tax=Kibdelosporangium persicum TaxID=2698649 RepID=A0ABX2F2A3_9PSEU|nr:TetR/AcrR family transcriptional regulator [Kibdelosporangium persicum]NRN64980.1 DNA-binding transcriptional regulator, AcrR family [Kibdelosporangium persicum]
MERIGRGEKVRAAVIAATLTELTEKGYAALTIDEIARRTGVHKTTIYRRWRDVPTLVLDAVTVHAEVDIPIPDSGDIERDLTRLATSFIGWATSTTGRAILTVLLSDAARIPEIAAIRRQLFEDGPRRADTMITAALARGDLPADVDPAELLKALIAPIFFEIVIIGATVDQKTAAHAVSVALAAARAGVLGRQ